MKTLKKIFSFSNATLLVALALSSIAAWYSIVGLTAIFAGAVMPIIIMGTALEFGKVVTTVWLRKYWHRCALIMKIYLVPAVFLLAVITSMGIFGFLSKAHSDQSLVSGDVESKVAIYDEKIKTARENIEADRKQLKQMDEAVDQVMARSTDEKGADKSNSIRKAQQRDRSQLAKDIEANQTLIASLNDEAAPIRAEIRKVEADVGPVKYIAALIYGDNPDNNLLERAVRWVIILLVAVFDPLALMLVIAANQSKEWDENDDVEEENKLREKVEHQKVMEEIQPITIVEPAEDLTNINHELQEAAVVTETIIDEPVVEEISKDPHTIGWMYDGVPHGENRQVVEEPILEKHPYLNQPFSHFENVAPIPSTPVTKKVEEPVIEEIPEIVDITPQHKDEDSPPFEGIKNSKGEWVQTGPNFLDHPSVQQGVERDHVLYNGTRMSMDALKGLHPELFIKADLPVDPALNFGNNLPNYATKGDTFVRTDVYPNKVFRFTGTQWIETNKDITDTYLTNEKYLNFLVEKISIGEYDPELLTDNERDAIEQHISKR